MFKVFIVRLTLKALIHVIITTANLDETYFFFFFFFNFQIKLDLSCESSDSHEMSSLIFSEKNNKISFRMSFATNLLSALRVNEVSHNARKCA